MCRSRMWFVVFSAIGLFFLYFQTTASANDVMISLDAQAVTMDEITVTADKIEAFIRNYPRQVTVVDRDEIVERNFLSVEEALGSMPGVDVKPSSGIGSRISIRGSGKSGGVLVLLDGRPISSSQYGGVDLSGIPIDMVKSVTVFKPPVPVWLGPGSSEGAISIETHGLKFLAGQSDPVKAGDGVNSGQGHGQKAQGATDGAAALQGSQHGNHGHGNGFSRHGAGHPAAASSPHTASKDHRQDSRLKISGGSYGAAEVSLSNLQNKENGSGMVTAAAGHKDGKRENSDRDKGSVNFHLDYKTDAAIQYDINGRYYLAEYGSAGPVDNPTPDARQRYGKGSIDCSVKGFMGEIGDYSVKTYVDRVDLKDEAQPRRIDGVYSRLISELDNVRYGMKADTTWMEDSGLWTLRLGGIAERDDVDHTVTGDHHRVTTGLHAQYERRMGRFTATFGLRGDHTTDFDFNPGVSGGLGWALSDTTLLKLNGGYTVQIPTFGQLYQPSHGSYDQTRGNPDLDEERITAWDFGVEHRFTKNRLLNLTLFRSDTRDAIVYLRGMVDDPLVYFPVNTDKALRHGIEGAMKWAVSDRFMVDGSYILQDSENSETDAELAYTPRHKVRITLRVTLPKWDTRMESTFRFESERFSEAEAKASQKLDDFATVDLKMIQPCRIQGQPLELFLNLYNVTDTDFEIHHGYPDDGIRFTAGLNMTF